MIKHRIIVMGVSGCGKTTIGDLVARELGVPFVDGDSLHPVENVAKMAAGTPLTDEDRWPWLATVGSKLAAAGLSVPGMPVGSPGMEVGSRKDPYQVLLIDKAGRFSVFADYPKS